MKILGICGSPRPKGNAELLLEVALAPFTDAGWDVTRLLISRQKAEPCRACGICRKNGGNCVIDDDMKNFYREYEACDALIISTPVYWRNVPAQLKAVFDRTYSVFDKQPLRGKLGGAMVIGGGPNGGQGNCLTIIHNYFLSCGALCVPSEVNGVAVSAEEPGEVLNDAEALRKARFLGENIIRHARQLMV